MLSKISNFPWISMAFSVRTSYEDVIIPKELVPDKLTLEFHHGFAEHEYEATKTYFDFYNIEYPSIPLLLPEFQNPLFLKLFCLSLYNKNLTKIPPGHEGISSIFNSFIDSVNEKLSRREYLDLDEQLKIVQKAINKLAEKMADKNKIWLPREEAQNIVNSFTPVRDYESSLFRHIISEGLLAEDMFWDNKVNERCDGIYFAYARFSDHIIADYLLDKYLDTKDPIKSFQRELPLGSIIKNEGTCSINRGLIEALCIQVPEKINKELVEVAPYCAEFWNIKEAFIDSLIFRKPSAISESTRKYINKHIIQYKHTHDLLLNAFITVASNKDHPHNADFLHKHLMKFKMADRDARWSIFILEQYGRHEAVDRLIEWGFSDEDRSHIDDESIRLCSIVLAWFLTSSHRFLRDRATKALVSLLTNRIHVLRQILELFQDVNDPYVTERLYAVAYGCAMRSTSYEEIKKLAVEVYKWIFNTEYPYSDILLRDYARGVIEAAVNRGFELGIDLNKVRPPYKSKWPPDIPTEEELKKYDKWDNNISEEEKALPSLYNSIMGFSDFARYVIGTNSGRFEWSSHPLDLPKEKSPEEIYEDFVDSLTEKQKEA